MEERKQYVFTDDSSFLCRKFKRINHQLKKKKSRNKPGILSYLSLGARSICMQHYAQFICSLKIKKHRGFLHTLSLLPVQSSFL